MNTYRSFGQCPECFCWGSHTQGCPNQPEETPVHRCIICKDGIYDAEEYKDFGNGAICYSCLQNLSPKELLKRAGDPIQIAKEVNA